MGQFIITDGVGDCNGHQNAYFSTTDATGIFGQGNSTNYFKLWLPFVVPIIKNAVIVSATLKLVAAADRSVTVCKVKIGCEAADNPATPADWADLNGRILSAAYTTDNAVAVETAGIEYSWDVTTAVQEITSRAGWVPGNTLAILIPNNGSDVGAYREIAMYEYSTNARPKLVIVTAEGYPKIINS